MTKNTKTTPESQVTTLHQGFDSYRAFIEHSAGAEATASEKHRLSVVARLREEHPDEPLDELNLDRCAHLIDHWRNRPFGRKRQSAQQTHLCQLPERTRPIHSMAGLQSSIGVGTATRLRTPQTHSDYTSC